MSAQICAPFTSSLQLHWLLRNEVAIEPTVTSLQLPSLACKMAAKPPNGVQVDDVSRMQLDSLDIQNMMSHKASVRQGTRFDNQ